MEPIYLRDVEQRPAPGPRADLLRQLQAGGVPFPQLMFLTAYKPALAEHLDRLTQEIMRGPSPLSPGQRELIAAFTSKLHDCPF